MNLRPRTLAIELFVKLINSKKGRFFALVIKVKIHTFFVISFTINYDFHKIDSTVTSAKRLQLDKFNTCCLDRICETAISAFRNS